MSRGFLYRHCVMFQGYNRVEPGRPELLGSNLKARIQLGSSQHGIGDSNALTPGAMKTKRLIASRGCFRECIHDLE
jgi:hypothetical protein